MELSIFMKELESALIKRGIPAELAHNHVASIRRTFTSDDLSEIASIKSESAINDLADSISNVLKKKMSSADVKSNDTANKAHASTPVASKPKASVQAQVKRPQRPLPLNDDFDTPVQQKNTNQRIDMNDEYFSNSSFADNSKGSTVFWVGLIATLPITLSLLALIAGVFAGIFVGLVGIILLGVLALIGIVGAGSALSLVGIIFGVTQLFSFVPAGIYEIGLGVIIAGAVLFVSVLIYNFIIRFIPWLIKKVAKLLVFVFKKLKDLFYYIRKECYKL
jgi:hypothetical protein